MDDITLIIEALEKRLSNTDSKYEWDDRMSIRSKDPKAEAIRRLCLQVSEAFPADGTNGFENPQAQLILEAILKALRNPQS